MKPFLSYRTAARTILEKAVSGECQLKRHEGQFLGGIAFDDGDGLTEKQANWLQILLRKRGLPELVEAQDGR